MDFDLAKQEDCKDVDVSALCIFYESADRPTITVKLAMEDGWAKIPDTAEISDFMERCKQRIAREEFEAKEATFYGEDADELVGDGFAPNARRYLDDKHEIGAWDIEPVPLRQNPNQDPFQSSEKV